MHRTTLKVQLVKHEGLRLRPYRCPAGKLTIGVGRNLDDAGLRDEEQQALFGTVLPKAEYLARLARDGLTEAQAMLLLDNDITACWKALSTKLVGVFTALDTPRQHVLMDMAFNLGVTGLLRFKKMLAAVEQRDFATAAREMLNSQWARQVGARAETLAAVMRGDAA